MFASVRKEVKGARAASDAPIWADNADAVGLFRPWEALCKIGVRMLTLHTLAHLISPDLLMFPLARALLV